MRAPLGLVALSAMVALGCGDGTDAMPRPSTLGNLNVIITVVGAAPDSDGFSVDLGSADGAVLASRTVDSTTAYVRFSDLTPGSYTLSTTSLADNCSVEGDDSLSVEILSSEVTAAPFVVSCPGPDVMAVYRLQDGVSSIERYYLNADSTFLLDLGKEEFEGTFAAEASRIVFSFGDPGDTRYQAIGTLHGTCMTVELSVDMAIDGEGGHGGEYCQ